MKFALFLSLCIGCITLSLTDFAEREETFDQIQELLRSKREVLGEGHYECYADGECVMEYKMGELVTYREEPLCARSEQGCGLSNVERQKRSERCTEMSESMEQRCKRSENEECAFLLNKIEEMDCEVLKRERRELVKRDGCRAIRKRFDAYCARSTGKRALSDECALVLQDMEDSPCDEEEIYKRSGTCDDGWSLNDGNCYKYFPGPLTFLKAESECESQSDDQSSHLATLERAIVSSSEDRAFFDSLISSSGAVDAIDTVLSQMSDHYNNSDWQDVIDYYDNWAFIGVKYYDNEWRWVSAKKEKSDWNDLKAGQSDWYDHSESNINNPSSINSTDIRTDHGHCVSYFTDGPTGEDGAWWNVPCTVELPFICEKDPY